MPLTFKSEEERQEALANLPDEPPIDVMDIDEWNAKIDQERTEIEEAEIVDDDGAPPKDDDAAPPAEPPAEGEPPASQQQQQDNDFVYDFGKIKRSDLPEEVRHYQNPGEIIKQFGHARKYANSLEEKLRETHSQIAELQQSASTVQNLQKEIERMKNERLAPPPAAPPAKPVSQQQPVNIQDISASVAKIEAMDDDDGVDAGSVKKVLRDTFNVLTEVNKNLSDTRNEFSTYRQNSEKTVNDLKGEVTSIKTSQQNTVQQQQQREAQRNFDREIADLQDTYPELRTTKPILSESGENVERDVRNFTDRIFLARTGRPAANWEERNRIIGSYLRGDDAELNAFLTNNGITPESVGASRTDMQAYLTIANIDAHSKGQVIDQFSGARRTLTNPFNGQPVNFPNLGSAYDYMLKSSGVTQAEINRMREDAEKRGQQNLQRSLEKRDTSAPIVSSRQSGDPNNVGQEMSEEDAMKILNDPDIAEKIEFGAIEGDRSWFNRYNKALRRLNLEQVQPEEHWPSELKRAPANA